MTDLPLFWGEGGVSAILNQGGGRAPAIKAMERVAVVTPADELTQALLAEARIVVLAQPRRLGASELTDLERWVQSGGRLLVFADPLLVWPSDYPLGDPRRAPPVTLLDPLMKRWRIDIGPVSPEDHAEMIVQVKGEGVTVVAAGRWVSSSSRCEADGLLARCKIGRGVALFVADADLLDSRRWTQDSGNERLIDRLLQELDAATVTMKDTAP